MSDIINKGLPKGVLSKHLWLIWLIKRFTWIKGIVLQHRAHNATKTWEINPCFQEWYLCGQQSVYCREIKVAGQDNITHNRTYPGRMKGRDRTCTHTHTPTTLIIQLYYYVTYNWLTPSVHRVKHRTNAEPTQNLRSGRTQGPTKSGHRTETLGASSRALVVRKYTT